MIACVTLPSSAQLILLPDSTPEPVRVFAGAPTKIDTTWRNEAASTIKVEVRARLHQTSSATTALVSERPWKPLQVLPGQTVLESAQLEFPAVKAETRFVIQWVEGTNHVLGTTEVRAYPADLLREVKTLGGEEAVGVFDPQNQIKPLLKGVNVEFMDLAESDFADFQGRLAVIGPFRSKAEMPEDLTARIKKLAQRGIGIVWIQPPLEVRDRISPSFYSVPIGKGTVVVAQASLFVDLPSKPVAQLNLIRMAELALRPERMALPHSSTE